jgi:hypothetical protein
MMHLKKKAPTVSGSSTADFDTREEEAVWWDTRDSTDDRDGLKPIQVLAAIDALQETMLEENGGVPFSSSVQIIDQMRKERSDELDQR